jgi:LysR family transcriptional regulator, regulator for genes of the gallate degradation pathway
LADLATYPNLRHLRLLDATNRLQSLTKAAAEVHISQPAATQAMARLETIYGEKLLVSGAKGLMVTESGDLVNKRGKRAFQHLREALNRDAVRTDRMIRQITVSSLRALAAFGEGGSFSGAALVLGQTEPAVQRAARAVERAAGIDLFTPGRRMIGLTQDGQRLAEAAGLALRELELAREDLAEAAGTFSGRVAVGTLPLIQASLLPDVIVQFTLDYPDARIEVLDGSYEDMLRSLKNGRADLILGALRTLSGSIHEQVLFTDRLSVIARVGHPLQGRATFAQAFRYPWVLARKGTPNRAVFDRYAEEFGFDLTGGYIETGSHVAARGVLLNSDRLALLSPLQVRQEIEAGLLCDLGIEVVGGARDIGITTLKGAQPTQLQSAFVERLMAAGAAIRR